MDDSKKNDVKISFLLTEKKYLESKLDMLQKAIEAADFLVQYYKIVEGKDVDIIVNVKEIPISETSEVPIENEVNQKTESPVTINDFQFHMEVFEEKNHSNIIKSDLSNKKKEIVVTPKKQCKIKKQISQSTTEIPEVTERRQELYNELIKFSQVFTANKVVDFYCDLKGKSFKNENFARNTVYLFCTQGLLQRVKGISPYFYGLPQWFKSNGALMDEYI